MSKSTFTQETEIDEHDVAIVGNIMTWLNGLTEGAVKALEIATSVKAGASEAQVNTNLRLTELSTQAEIAKAHAQVEIERERTEQRRLELKTAEFRAEQARRQAVIDAPVKAQKSRKTGS
jgi:hypothetical protein